MVVVWNGLAGGDAEYCAAIVAMNPVVTILLYSLFASLFINELPDHMGVASNAEIHVSFQEVAENVAIYMSISFGLALLRLPRAKAIGDASTSSRYESSIGERIPS